MSDLSFQPDEAEIERRVEALLFAAAGPLTAAEIAARLPENCNVARAISGLRARYEGRGVELECVADRWRFRTAPDLAFMMTQEREEPRRLSKAALETLAIIAYHQPVTRAEIEEIRGVAVSRGTLDQLIEMGWVRLGRRRQTPGRPVTFVVTDSFLDHFGLGSTRDLPGLTELQAAGLLDSRPPLADASGLAESAEDADILPGNEPGDDLFGD